MTGFRLRPLPPARPSANPRYSPPPPRPPGNSAQDDRLFKRRHDRLVQSANPGEPNADPRLRIADPGKPTAGRLLPTVTVGARLAGAGDEGALLGRETVEVAGEFVDLPVPGGGLVGEVVPVAFLCGGGEFLLRG